MAGRLARLALCLACAVPCAAGAEALYAGKTVTIIVGYKPGGGYDATARLLAQYLPKYLPGAPTVIVQNMPGANSMIAANHLYNAAKPDGLTLGTFNHNLPIAQLTGVKGVQFDMLKFAWIGSAASETTILTVRADLPYRTFEDLKRASSPVVIGTTGPGANTYDFPLLLKDLAGANLKIVTGYSSSADIMLAVERKEVDGRAGSYSSMLPFIERKLVRPILRARTEEPGTENLPVDETYARSARAKAIMALRAAPEAIGRPYVMPPGTPDTYVRAMREAFARAIADPEAAARAVKGKVPLHFVPGDQALKVLSGVLHQPKDVVDEFAKYVKFGG